MTVYGDPYTFLTNYSLSIYKRIRFKWISKIIYFCYCFIQVCIFFIFSCW